MELPKRKTNRLPNYDYSTANAYFLTVCLSDHQDLLWQPVGAITDRPQKIQLTRCGQIVDQSIRAISDHYPSVTVDHYVIMPDHIHLLLQIHADDGRSLIAPTVSRILKQFKGSVTKQAGRSIWQKGFYDHIIRDENDYLTKWQYIEGNRTKLAEKRHWEGLLFLKINRRSMIAPTILLVMPSIVEASSQQDSAKIATSLRSSQ